MDVGEYFDQWMVRQRLRLQPRTWDAYQLTIEPYVAPTLANTALDALGPEAIEQLYGHPPRARRAAPPAAVARDDPARPRGAAQGARGRGAHRPALGEPADRVALPRHDLRGNAPTTVQAWTADEARRFLQRTGDDAHANLWAVALGTGMRRGELLGLRWRDVDLDDRLVTVAGSLTEHRGQLQRKSTKTTGSAACSSTAEPLRRSNANDGRPRDRPPPTSSSPTPTAPR